MVLRNKLNQSQCRPGEGEQISNQNLVATLLCVLEIELGVATRSVTKCYVACHQKEKYTPNQRLQDLHTTCTKWDMKGSIGIRQVLSTWKQYFTCWQFLRRPRGCGVSIRNIKHVSLILHSTIMTSHHKRLSLEHSFFARNQLSSLHIYQKQGDIPQKTGPKPCIFVALLMTK